MIMVLICRDVWQNALLLSRDAYSIISKCHTWHCIEYMELEVNKEPLRGHRSSL
jgi:hypothetical protein